ncbi:hypothetical protein O0235_02890 [Tepidiforma flava]|uniref:Glycosyltransferase family 4 protein n=1 Tax=Tepidiforma flava TaxID=3004094 RepID=A0ABY7M7L2_9CHLR|nr:hypothetical protein [Tepidiforma flava]WBL36519.1 hypothetical protein O0235_02890 [Tepidiforma flava]
MRLLIATDSFPPKIDGVSDTAATVARVLGQLGHTPRVVAPAPGPRCVERAQVARIRSLPAPLYPSCGWGGSSTGWFASRGRGGTGRSC